MAEVWGIPESEIPRAGKSAYRMLDSLGQPDGVRALLVVGTNLAVSAPHVSHIQERLTALDFLGVSDFFLSETAQLADVVFPSAQWAEEQGTTTNLEGRVILRQQALQPPVGVRSDIELLCGIAARLGKDRLGNDKAKFFSYGSTREVFDELRRASAGGAADYSGIDYDKIAANDGVYWPCPAGDHPGTPRMFTDGFPTSSGKARFLAAHYSACAEEPDVDYPFHLTTGRLLAQYQSGTQTRRIDALLRLAPEPIAEIHPEVAKRYGLVDGDIASLATRRGQAKFKVKLAPGIQQDTIFVPFHWGSPQAANQLTNPALDPISQMPEFKVCAVRIAREEGVIQ